MPSATKVAHPARILTPPSTAALSRAPVSPCYDSARLHPPRIGISLGDPTGIGPEIVARALAERPGLDVTIFGDRGVLARAAAIAGVPPPVARVVEVTHLRPEESLPGHPTPLAGRAQAEYLREATVAATSGTIDALVTAPLSKEWAARGGFAFPGHTEYLAEAAGGVEVAMMLAGPRLRVTVATTHIALRDVFTALSPARIASCVVLTARVLRDGFGLLRPRVALAGLNPHAGEAGQFGDEEARLLAPALALARTRLQEVSLAAEVSGPHVPDVVFRQGAEGTYDAVVGLYHDQGLIPIKMIHFDDAVNVTLGLPFVRTSPDHGTAYDIAGTGRARASSFLAALDMAVDMVRRRAGQSAKTAD